MGWVSQRHMNTSGGLNRNPSNNGSQKGPLRKRVQFIAESGSGMMKREKWLLECGHEGWGSYGATKMRCGKCKRANPRLHTDGAYVEPDPFTFCQHGERPENCDICNSPRR